MISELKGQKKYGLVWDTEQEPEEIVKNRKKELPVLSSQPFDIRNRPIH